MGKNADSPNGARRVARKRLALVVFGGRDDGWVVRYAAQLAGYKVHQMSVSHE